jgi:hypothetical protein
MGASYVIGDIHGQYDKMTALLRASGLTDDHFRWTGGAAHLWFMGDFFDRGPDGVRTVDLVMALQTQAAQAGGRVHALLGNHDMLILATHHFGQNRPALWQAYEDGQDLSHETVDFFTANWLHNGGRLPDLNRLSRKHGVWLSNLPAMAHTDGKVMAHADSGLYQRFGDSIEEVNKFFKKIMSEGSAEEWIRVLDAFSEHSVFFQDGGAERADMFLKIFGGEQLIHGHTPIMNLTQERATHALVYADGLCVNVDGGMYLGGSGFIYEL